MQQLLALTTAAFVDVQPWSGIQVCTYFPAHSSEVAQRFSIADSEIIVPSPGLRAPPRQHPPTAISRRTARRYFVQVQVQVQDRRKSADASVHTSSGLRRLYSAPTTPEVFQPQL